jgi:hypothetical protein
MRDYRTLSKTVAALTLQDWIYLVIAVRELIIARVRYATRPSARIVLELQDDFADSGPIAEVDLQRLSWAIGAAAGVVPWRSDCLPQAMAARRWLRRSGVRSQFFIGVKKQGEHVVAHAWLNCGEFTVTGGVCQDFVTLIEPNNTVDAS